MEKKFYRKKFDECWALHLDKNYYQYTHINGISIGYHVISYVVNYNRIPNQLVMHLCNNRNCVNPSHLMSGTQSDNLQYARFFHDCYKKELDLCQRPNY